MGVITKIEWTDHTFNPWWGCTNVSPACDHCYAESLAKRTGHDVWGKDGGRRFFGDKHWNEPLSWNAAAEKNGQPETVFCASMADVFEDHPALPSQRERLWELIARTPWLTWQLLTKRPENVLKMAPWPEPWPHNVWVGATAESQRYAERRIRFLLDVPAVVRFLSCEPLLGPVDLGLAADHRGHERDYAGDYFTQCLDCSTEDEMARWTYPAEPRIHWVIAGGESGGKARPSHPDWFRSLRDQCRAGQVPFLFKQWGDWGPAGSWPGPDHTLTADGRLFQPGEHGVDQLLQPAAVHRWGKKEAGRLLDGRTWDQMPERLHP